MVEHYAAPYNPLNTRRGGARGALRPTAPSRSPTREQSADGCIKLGPFW